MKKLVERRPSNLVFKLLVHFSWFLFAYAGFQSESLVNLRYFPMLPPNPLVPIPPKNGAESVKYRSPLTHMASIRSAVCPDTCFCSKLTFNCDSANISSLPIGMPPTLLYANFHNNRIRTIPANFLENLPNLQVIDLRNNFIEKLDAGTFDNLPQLTTILLDDNLISSIAVGALQNLPALRHIRISNNSLVKLVAGTFQDLPRLETIRLNLNQTLSVVEIGTFRRLGGLLRIQMNGTLTNYTLLGPYDYGKGRGYRTFAPDCPKLREIDLGNMKIRALEPDTLQNMSNINDFLVRIRRVGEFLTYSTKLQECDLLNQGEIILELPGTSTTTLCVPTQGAGLDQSPSTSQKDHLKSFSNPSRRLLDTDEDQAMTSEEAHRVVEENVLKSMGNLEQVPNVLHGMPLQGMDRRHLTESLQAGIIYEEFM